LPPARRNKTSNALKCFCARKPLLAFYGVDEKGKIYIHVKVYKQDRIFGELWITGGTVKIRCRECLRIHTVVIKEGTSSVELI
jgi:hypothetical protein